MNAQNQLKNKKKVVHQADERPKSVGEHEKGRSSIPIENFGNQYSKKPFFKDGAVYFLHAFSPEL
jgi:hypothetical protein